MSEENTAANATVTRNDEESRYVLEVDGQRAGFIDFRELDNGLVELPHTEVDKAFGGRGLGTVLVKGTLDDLVARGKGVVPTCPFVKKYIDEHPVAND